MPSHLPYIAISAFDIIALAAVIGSVAAGLWIIPEGARECFHRPLWRLTGASLGVLTASSLLLLVGRTLEMSRQPLHDLGHWLPLVVHETSFGHIWMVRPMMLIVAWVAWLMSRRPSHHRAAYGVFLATAVIAFTRSATGHPADQGQWTAPEWVDWVHLIFASIWAGGLFATTVAIFPSLPQAPLAPTIRRALVERLSFVAAVALAAILVTGILSAYHYLGGFAPLFHSAYGHILLVKLGLVAIAVALGATNRFVFVPQIRAASDKQKAIPGATDKTGAQALSRLRRSVTIETVFLTAVLIAAAALLHGMPPRERNSAMGGTMARATQPMGRLEAARFESRETSRLAPSLSTIRYGVLHRSMPGTDNAPALAVPFGQMSL